MLQFDSILSLLRNETYPNKKQLLEYTLNIVKDMQRNNKRLKPTDKAAILEYAYDEVDALITAIPNTESYKEKDLIFTCENLLLGLIMQLCPDSDEVPRERLAKINILVETVSKERYIETAIDNLFEQKQIEEAEISNLLSLVNQTEDEYQRGMLCVGLLHYKDNIARISDAGKSLVAAHLAAEFKRFLCQKQLDEDCINYLEVASDVSKYFATYELVGLLYNVLELGYCNVNYYIVNTLISLGQDIPSDVILALSRNLEYAYITHAMLAGFGKKELFPQEYADPEYLAKSDMVQWLMYPTELGKAPDEIEYIGKITYLFKKDVYYVFKYRSADGQLTDDLKNKWLIGWSSENGGTFSNFDEYALFEKSSIKATLKKIKRKLIG